MIRRLSKEEEKIWKKCKMLNNKDLNLKDTEVKETLSEIPLENNVNTTQKTYLSYVTDTFSSIYNYLINKLWYKNNS
jgi:hypothetical protein